MKSRFKYTLLLLLPVVFSCHEDPVNPQTNECVGVSFYYLDNQSSRNVSVGFTSLAILNAAIDSTATANAKQITLIGQDASFGSIPKPTDTFSRFNLYALVDGKRVLVYAQRPVQDALWTKKNRMPATRILGVSRLRTHLLLRTIFCGNHLNISSLHPGYRKIQFTALF